MTRSAFLAAFKIASSFSGPTGSFVVRSPAGFVDRNAKIFVVTIDPYPHACANPTQRRFVGSSWNASAVDGFNMRKFTVGSEDAQVRVSRYLWTRS
jgi:hypothetical protein